MAGEINYLKKSLSKLRDLGLISIDEELKAGAKLVSSEMKAEIYDFIRRKDLAVAIKIVCAVKEFEMDFKNQSVAICFEGAYNPMRNDLIMEQVFTFLSVADLKNCRSVCKQWNSVLEPLLRKRLVITFHRSSLQSPSSFTGTAGNSTFLSAITSFKFKKEWNVAELKEFFEQSVDSVKEIYFDYLLLYGDRNEMIGNYDIVDWIKTSQIKTLFIGGQAGGPSPPRANLKISLKDIPSVQSLILQYCSLKVTPLDRENRLRPKELELKWVEFYLEEEEMNLIRINDYVNFSTTQLIYLSTQQGEISFDLAECLNVKTLKLSNVTVLNWEMANAKITKLDLSQIDLLQKTKHQIKELEFQRGVIDLCALPMELERMKLFGNTVGIEISCTQPIALPNLTAVTYTSLYDTDPDALSFLQNFLHCSNLVDIDVSNPLPHFDQSTDILFNLDWVPASVKRIKMTGLENVFRNEGSRAILTLDTLVVTCCSFHNVVSILTIIQPKILVFSSGRNVSLYEKVDDLLRFIQQCRFFQKLLVGTFQWKGEHYRNCRLSSYVDKESDFYLFENQKGKAIQEAEFLKMSNF